MHHGKSEGSLAFYCGFRHVYFTICSKYYILIPLIDKTMANNNLFPQIGCRLLTLLNTMDLLFCVSSTMVLITGSYYSDNNQVLVVSFSVFNFLYCALLEGTAFVTCTLTVTRTVSLCIPFYRIHQRKLWGILGTFLAYLVARGGLYLYVIHSQHAALQVLGDIYDKLGLVEVSVMLGCVCVASTITCVKLFHSQQDKLGRNRVTDRSRDASVTVIILSGLFLVFNLGFVVMLALQVSGCESHNSCLSRVLYELGMQGIPLNSALNPVVYFARNQQMMEFLRGLFCYKLRACLERQKENFRLLAYFKK